MTEKTISGGWPSLSDRGADAALALGAALLVLAIEAMTGFKSLADFRGDNDSLLRLVQIRDLIAGQGWFDLAQYRMGLDGGFVMHWSRLVDAPIAAIMLAVAAITGSAALGESAALVLWPALLFAAAIYFLLRIARMFDEPSAVLPAAVLGGAALHFIGIFSPGAIDHHNVQLTACLASLCFLLEAPAKAGAALLSGACAAIMLAVGMETAPYVAAIGICVAGLFLFDGAWEKPTAQGFGCGFAAVSALVFVTTVPVSAWSQTQCDAFSRAQFLAASIAGTGLALAASIEAASRTRERRLVSLGLLGFTVGAVAVLVFPQCLAAPYSMLDPRLKSNWLDHISEAQSLFRLVMREPEAVLARYATPLLALSLLAMRFRAGNPRRQDVIVGAAMLAAFAVSVWQVRGSTFSIGLAVVPLSAWVGGWRQRAEASPSPGVAARMVAVWLVCVNPIWTGAAAAASAALETDGLDKAETSPSSCEREADFARLAGLPASVVLAVSNLGSPILAYSGHHVFAGLYHRNVDGNLLAMDAFMGSPADALVLVERHRVGLVALCRGNAESVLLARRAPDGLLAAMMRGETPDWLEIIPESQGEPLQIYRVAGPG